MRRIWRQRFAAIAASLALIGAGSAFGAQAEAAPAAQPGVTPTTITVGNVVVLTGPVPGLFAGGLYGLQAYFNYVNSKGGVNGRKLLISSGDDGLACAQNLAVTKSLSTSVFAFVGNFSVYDSCGAPVFSADPTLPDMSLGLTPQVKALANNFNPQPNPDGFRTGPYKYFKSVYPKAITKAAGLYGLDPGAEQSWEQQTGAMDSVGFKFVYSRGINPTESMFTSDIIRMRAAGVQFLYLTDIDIAQTAQVVDAAYQQGWHPQVIMSESAYDPNFFKLVNPKAAQGMLFDENFSLFDGEDAATVPEVALFDKWMHTTKPGFAPDLYSMYSWAAGALFTQALKAAGPNPTRVGLLAALKKISNFSDNGMLAPANVGAKKPPTCYLIGKVENGKYVRTSPLKGFRCQPGGYYYGSGTKI
jgi:ABC-type branched-subunit amino acid transport system substrate-binding protein